jgi:Glycosyl hydrolase family 26
MVLAVVAISLTPVPAHAAGRAIGPLSPPSGTWFGGTVNPVSNDGGGSQAEIATRETFLGRRYDIVNRFYTWNQAFPTALEAADVSNGRFPMVTWCCSDTLQMVSGSQDSLIRAQADRMAAFGSPIFLRFYHEMDGDRRQGAVHSTAAFIAAWRYVHNIFVQRGATNVIWIWCPTAWKFIQGNPWPPNYYPGDAYVDWIASDGYSWYPSTGAWRTWTQIFQPFYDWAITMNKPIMIAENGVMEDPAVAGRKAAWITDSQNVLKNVYPLIQAVLYFDTVGNSGPNPLDWRVSSSQAAYQAYRTMALDPYFNPSHSTDTSPPSTPGRPAGTSNSSTTIDLSWNASIDDQSASITYRVSRDGAQVGVLTSGSTTTVQFQDTGLQPSSTHTYTVIAADTAGNTSAPSPPSGPITVQEAPPPPPSIFADDFSSGAFANWSGVSGLSIDSTRGGVAPPSARAQVNGTPAWASRALGATFSSLCVSANLNLSSQGSNFVAIMRLQSAASVPIARVFLNSSGVLWVKSDVSGLQRSSNTQIGTGWHNIELCGSVGAAGAWDLYRDGTPIVAGWVANTGSAPIGRIEIGDNVAKTFTINFDDVIVDLVAGT